MDYKECFSFIKENGDCVKVDVAVVIWGFSRHIYRKVIRDKTTTSTIEFLAEAFEYYGGIPKELIVDNPKALVFKHNPKTGKYILNTEFEQFACDYGINIRPAKPYRPETKGKVERTMRDIEDMKFIDNNENIIFVGTPGVGKTHLATAFGIESAKKKIVRILSNATGYL